MIGKECDKNVHFESGYQETITSGVAYLLSLIICRMFACDNVSLNLAHM